MFFRPCPGYKTQPVKKQKSSQENIYNNLLAAERTKVVVETFKKSDELTLRIRKEELEEKFDAAGGKWYKVEEESDDDEANAHYDALEENFYNEELHQKFWEEEDWFKMWDHATSNQGYLPMEW